MSQRMPIRPATEPQTRPAIAMPLLSASPRLALFSPTMPRTAAATPTAAPEEKQQSKGDATNPKIIESSPNVLFWLLIDRGGAIGAIGGTEYPYCGIGGGGGGGSAYNEYS